jgi:hypothetical protein
VSRIAFWFASKLGMEGELLKKNKLVGWSSRYFVVSKSTCSVLIYKDKTKSEVSAAIALFSPPT